MQRLIHTRTLCPAGVLLALAAAGSPALAQLGAEAEAAARCTAQGTYNSSLIDVAAPHDENTQVSNNSLRAGAALNFAEGPLWANCRAYVQGFDTGVSISLQARPQLNLGSDLTATASAKFAERFRFSRLPANVRRGEAVFRLEGFYRKSEVPLSASPGTLAFIAHGPDEVEERTLIRLEESGRRSDTCFVDLVDLNGSPTLLDLLLPHSIFTCRAELSLNLLCKTGAEDGVALPATTFARFGVEREIPPSPGPAAAPEGGGGGGDSSPPAGSAIHGLRFLDADGNVVAVQPGDVAYETASGLSYPVLGPVLPWLSNADDFDDNAKNTEEWGEATGTGALDEVEFSLEYSAGAGAHSATWPLRNCRAPLTENWEIQSDVHWEPLTFSQPGDEAGIGLRVSSGAYAGTVRMQRIRTGAATARNFVAAEDGPAGPAVTTMAAPAASGAVRLSYHSGKKELSYWYDPNGPVGGYAWTLMQQSRLGAAGWNLPAEALLEIEIGGWSAGAGVPSATAWLDNFRAGSWEPFSPQLEGFLVEQDSVTLTGYAEPYQAVVVEASDNLQTWTALAPLTASAAGTLSFTAPMENRTQRYFRLRY